ncbi:translation initiation factor IF-6 [Candidatus Micrarchaeota archaeon]|nr:translation initiation factor IF-6 [Candidatus Micrarchaeota archaeon]
MAMQTSAYDGNPHIGMFARANEALVLLPLGAHPKFVRAADALGARRIAATVASSNLIGIFCALNSHGIVVPSFAEEEEKGFFKGLGLNVCVLPSMFAAVGNNICANDKGAIVNPDIPAHWRKKIGECLHVEAVPASIAGYKTVGSACIATNKGFAAHNRANDEEMEMLRSVFGVQGANATVNMGSPFIGLGVVANSKGCMMGEATSGFESSRIMNALGME